jgi:S1-C subfamily serine protease
MTILNDLSNALADATAAASRFVVAVSGGTRFGASGVVWDPGVVLTTRSTLRRDAGLHITLPDGESIPATIAGHDPGTDIAVLRHEASTGERPALTSASRPGQLVLAVGRAENTGVNAALGTVSAVGPGWQTWQGGKIDSYLRLDVPLHPGTSGAAVFNTAGELAGIVTGALSRIAPLAIPPATLARVAAELLAQGKVRRAWLGVAVQPVALPAGLVVLAAEADTPAAKAGVLVGDILLALDGAAVRDPMELRHLLAARRPGQTVRVALSRGGEQHEVEVVLGERNGRR